MNPWLIRLIIIILAVAFVPLVVEGTAKLVVQSINSFTKAIHDLLVPFSQTGEARLQGLIRLCLYLISITFLVKFLLGGGRKR